MNVKNYVNDYSKCGLIFLAFVAIFVFAMFTPENFANYQTEVILSH